MNTFDDIRVLRKPLARTYLKLMDAQPERPLALFAPRRVGKTFFLDQDLTPAAKAAGYLPIYVDVWLSKEFPLEAVNHALEEAFDRLRVPVTAVGKVGKSEVKKLSLLGSGVDFGAAPQMRALPDNPAFRFDSLLSRVAREFGGKILLMLDEVQAFGSHPDGIQLISSLRAALTKNKPCVRAIFTGSSQSDLTAMFTTAGAPMYQYAQTGSFPYLGEEYLHAISEHFHQVHPRKSLSIPDLSELFAQIGYKPAILREIVKVMSAEGTTDVNRGLNLYINSEMQVMGWTALLDQLDKLDQLVLHKITEPAPALNSKDTIAQFSKILGESITIAKIRAATDKLARNRLIAKKGRSYIVDDELFALYIQQRTDLATLNSKCDSVPGSRRKP